MYKYSSDGNANNSSIVENDDYDTLNKSYNSALSATSSINGSTSSKAVLAALRALQDKIRRLESERTQALDEASQLKHQLQTQSIEAEHLRQKENLSIQKQLQEARASHDRLLTEKNDLEARISKMEERNKSSLHMADDFQSRIRMLEDEKHAAALRLKELENRHHQFESQIKSSEHKEKGMFYVIVKIQLNSCMAECFL
jgi:chromosome segregation ATPase